MNSFFNNWPLKLTALLLSVGLWSHVRGEMNPLETATFSVRLDARAPSGFRFEETPPKSVRVSVRAPRQELRLLSGVALPLSGPLSAGETDAPPVAGNGLKASLELASLSRESKNAQVVPVRVEAVSGEIEVLGVKPANVSVVLKAAR